MADKLILCDKCGFFKLTFDINKTLCPVCKNKVIDIEDSECPNFLHMSPKEKEDFAINYIGHDFDPQLKDERIYYLANRKKHIQAIAQKNAKVSCPYCKSTNTKKITNTSKVVHTVLFGIFSTSRNSKQWHCNNCNSDF